MKPYNIASIGLLSAALFVAPSLLLAAPADESLWDDGDDAGSVPAVATSSSEQLWDDGDSAAATPPAPSQDDLWDDGADAGSGTAMDTGTGSGDLWDDTASSASPDPGADSAQPGGADDPWSDSPDGPDGSTPASAESSTGTAASADSVSFELSGDISAEYRYFWKSPLNNDQSRNDPSIAAKPRLRWQWDGGAQSFTLQPFARVDRVDSERSHADLREALYQASGGPLTVRIGVGQVFWGITEARHVVDIINQTDLIENPEQEDKLGQPMINATLYDDSWGNVDLFVLPWFRERVFPGRHGRLRTTPRVLNKDILYSDDSKRSRIDVAARWSHNIDAWDIAISQFHGTSREPLFVPQQRGSELVLLQSYDIIDQTGLELQYATDSALLKLEGYSRWGQGEQFFALDTGIEYTFGDVGGSGADIGLLAEYLYEGRDLGRWNDAIVFNSFSNAVMAGMRFALNDVAGTDGLASIIFDRKSNAKLFKLEASRRLNDNMRLNLQVFGFIDIPADDPAYTLRRDSFAKLELSYYF